MKHTHGAVAVGAKVNYPLPPYVPPTDDITYEGHSRSEGHVLRLTYPDGKVRIIMQCDPDFISALCERCQSTIGSDYVLIGYAALCTSCALDYK